MSQNENKATQTEENIDKQLQQLEQSVSELTKQQQKQQQIQQPNNYNIQPDINDKMQQLQKIDNRINEINQFLSSNQNLPDDKKNAAKAELDKLYKDGNRLCAEIEQHSQRYQTQLNNSLQMQPFNGVIDINTPQGQQLLAMIRAQDPRIKVNQVPGTSLLQVSYNDSPIYELNNKQQPIKRVHSKIDAEKDESTWEYILGGFIILMAILSCVVAFVNLDKQVDNIKSTRAQEKVKKEEKPETTEQKDSGSVEVKEEACVATTTHKEKDGVLYGNCDPKKTDVKGVELTNDAKQALNTVANPHDSYTITNSNGTKQTAYSISGTSNGQIHWRDSNGKIYHADKDLITITNKSGQTLSDGAENIICNLRYEQQQDNKNVVDWYYNSNTLVQHNPSTGNVIDITYQNNNSTWGTTGITQGQIGIQDAIGTLPLTTIQNATQQTNIGNTFLAPFSVDGTTLKVNDLSTTYNYSNNTCIGSYDTTNGFQSNIGDHEDLRQVVETENKVLADDSKLQYTDANGDTKTLHENVYSYEVNNGKLKITYNYNEDKGTYDTKIYNLADYNNLNISSGHSNSAVSNSQLKLAGNVQKYVDPNSGNTYVYANGLKAKTTGTYGSDSYNTDFTLGSISTSLSNLNADDIRSNETLTNMYNNNNKLYNYIRLNEGYDPSKFTTNSINNYNQLSNLYSLCNCRSY